MGNHFEIERKCVCGACRWGRAQRQGLLARYGGKGRLSLGPRSDKLGGVKELPVAHHDPICLIAPPAGLAQLNERSRDIFRQIVESYLATGEPVGSRNISRLIALP